MHVPPATQYAAFPVVVWQNPFCPALVVQSMYWPPTLQTGLA
jgi:hypothetical protein